MNHKVPKSIKIPYLVDAVKVHIGVRVIHRAGAILHGQGHAQVVWGLDSQQTGLLGVVPEVLGRGRAHVHLVGVVGIEDEVVLPKNKQC